jgi:hypothetical protein
MLCLPGTAIAAITEDVRAYGRERVETGGFFLSPIDDRDQISTLALAGIAGVTRKRGLFVVSGGSLDRLFAWADERQLCIPAQFHSHGGRAFLSSTDRAHGLCVRGFVTCVVPFWSDPSADPARWGWWRFDGVRWVDERRPVVDADRTVLLVTFDERGVR